MKTTYKYLFSPITVGGQCETLRLSLYYHSIQEESDTDGVKRHYNVQLSSVRMVVEQAFGLLKGRFKCLMRTILFRRSSLQVLQIQTISIKPVN